MGGMTWDEAVAELERMNARRQAQEAARRAAITPHVRRAAKKKPPRMSGPRYFPEQYADYRPTNYCGAPLTAEDWSRRSALAKVNATLVVDARVCPECLRLAAER